MSKTKPKKREITRKKVIQAAINSIYRDGFHAAHTNRIAEEAGVSWGVLQYHFGDKDGLLQAVIDHIFEDFLQTLAHAEVTGEDLEQRLATSAAALLEAREKGEVDFEAVVIAVPLVGHAPVAQDCLDKVDALLARVIPSVVSRTSVRRTQRKLPRPSFMGWDSTLSKRCLDQPDVPSRWLTLANTKSKSCFSRNSDTS